MGEKVVRFSDLSGQMAQNPEELVGIVVTEHPDLESPVRLEAMPNEIEQLGKFAIAAVGLEVTRPDDEEPSRFVLTVNNFNKLATGRPMEEVLAGAEPVAAKSTRRSHNKKANGEPLQSYNTPELAGLPHKGKIGDAEAAFVRDNLELVNERRVAAGHAPVDPTNPSHAKRYGFGAGGAAKA